MPQAEIPLIPGAPGSAQRAPSPTERLGRGVWVEARALSSILFAREATVMGFTAVWPLILSLRKPWLEAAPGKALDGTRARGYGSWAAVSPPPHPPERGKCPQKQAKRASGCEKTNFCLVFLTQLLWSDPVHAASIHPKAGKRALGRAKRIQSSGWNTEIKLSSCDFEVINH